MKQDVSPEVMREYVIAPVIMYLSDRCGREVMPGERLRPAVLKRAVTERIHKR